MRRNQSSPSRVQVNVIDRCRQIAALRTDGDRLVPACEEVAPQAVADIEPPRVGSQQPLHARHKVWLRRANDEMKMLRHQDVRVNVARIAMNRRRGAVTKQRIVRRAPETFSAVVTAQDDMLGCFGRGAAEDSWHTAV